MYYKVKRGKFLFFLRQKWHGIFFLTTHEQPSRILFANFLGSLSLFLTVSNPRKKI